MSVLLLVTSYFSPEDRPSFTELVVLTSDIINRTESVPSPPARPPRPGYPIPTGPPARTYLTSRQQ